MKKLTLALIAFFALNGSNAQTPDSAITYEQIDQATFKCVRLDPNKPLCFYRERWLLVGRSHGHNILRDIKSPQNEGYWIMANSFLQNVSALSKVEFNCKKRLYRHLVTYTYNGLYLNGPKILEEPTGSWESVTPMSSSETMMDFYCKHDDPSIKKKPSSQSKEKTISL